MTGFEEGFDFNGFLRRQKQITGLYEARSAAAAAECGIGKPEADVLLFLANNPGYDTAADAAAYRGFSKAYVSKAVERLTAAGLVTAATDPNDRRFQRLKVTEAAAAKLKILHGMQARYLHKLCEGIPAQAMEQYLSVMKRFAENAERAAGGIG